MPPPQRGAQRLRRGAGGGHGREAGEGAASPAPLQHAAPPGGRGSGREGEGTPEAQGGGGNGSRLGVPPATPGAAAGQVPGDLACRRLSHPPPPGRDPGTGADRGRGADPEASSPGQPLAARPSPAEGKPPPVSAWRLRLSPAPLPPRERGRGDAERGGSPRSPQMVGGPRRGARARRPVPYLWPEWVAAGGRADGRGLSSLWAAARRG